MTAEMTPTNPGGVLTTVHPSEQRIAGPRLWALTSGIAGLVANVLLALFYPLARPFSDVQNSFGWLGTANDWVILVQFLAMIPVAMGLRGRLPLEPVGASEHRNRHSSDDRRGALQLSLVAGVAGLPDVEVVLVVAAFLLSSTRGSSSSVRSGIVMARCPDRSPASASLLGASFPVALLITAWRAIWSVGDSGTRWHSQYREPCSAR